MTGEAQTGRTPVADRPHMPGYGVLPADEGDGLLPFSWAEERLAASRSYWLATTTPDGRPHLMALWGVWCDGALVFSTGRQSRKARNLAADPRCSLATERADEPVVVEGVARGVAPGTERFDRVVDAYREKYDVDLPTMDEPVFELRPERVLGFIEAEEHFAGAATRWTFPAT